MEFGSGLMHCTVAQVAGPLRLPDPSHPQFVVCSSSVDPGRTAAHLNIFGIEALHPCLRLGVQRGATVPSVCRASPLDNSMASRAGAVREGKGTSTSINNDKKSSIGKPVGGTSWGLKRSDSAKFCTPQPNGSRRSRPSFSFASRPQDCSWCSNRPCANSLPVSRTKFPVMF